MNLGLENLRELLESFLSNTGGKRGRDRQRAREEARADAGVAGEPGAAAGDAGAAATGTAVDAGQVGDAAAQPGSDAGGGAGTTAREERPDPEDLDDDEVVDDLYHRIEGLEDDLNRKDAQLGTIQDSQEQVAERVESVDDTIRQLVGIYDRLTDDINPFTGDGEDERGFDVFGDGAEEGFGLSDADRENGAADETVSFADLRDAIDEAATAEADGTTGQTITFDEEPEAEGDSSVEVQATEQVDDGTEDDEDDADGVTLDALAPTYASDVLVFEWLTELVRTAGPAATLRAISYYDEIGWIDDEVRAHLERVLSGPDLDIHVDPETAPEELTAEDHADSYTYIMKLDEIHRTRQDVES